MPQAGDLTLLQGTLDVLASEVDYWIAAGGR